MCQFITVAMPPETDVATLRPVWARYGRTFAPVTNREVQAMLPPNAYYGTVAARGQCDCGTAIGAGAPRVRRFDDEVQLQRKAAQLRQKGWSAAKVERWLTGRRGALRASGSLLGGDDGWPELLRELFATGGCPRFGVLLHWYSVALQDEELLVQDAVEVRIDEVTPAFIAAMREDVLYWFVP